MTHIFTVTLPDIGEGVVEGEVIEWLKKIDEELKQDEPVVIVMTDKATVELPAPYPGKLAKMYIQPGQMAIKGKALYDIEVAENVATHKNLTREKTAPSTPAPLKKAL
ncbi:MAG: 2-oxo acid dehydrogenase subunit E2, partial [Pseudanabaena sp. M57BS1SP1A06MG]|nr:2-oxo acid dehydrogenase subunit E2 [Pseudanabaena sp. M57BS1SP1A06MG]